ncbi:MAG: methyltransferase domain-containing protein, partial [Pseudohongiella sp.]|nr:methyltransferase domain-containing protein [Pseudohongiella sp.]
MADRNFDILAQRFENILYDKPRGQLRLQLVSEALLEDCAAIQQDKALRVLDVGCGLGQMAQLLASHGHQITACDVSSVMLQRAQ